MLTEHQAALIQRIKSCLREEAGVPSFERRDPVIPAHPTLEDVVARSGSSPAHLRCQKCMGELLSGIQSHVCIYCGRRQMKDVLPPCMSFTSTVAYRRFLESLGLNGSEVACMDTEKERSTRRRDVPNKEIPLSELLDFKLEWPQGSEDLDNKDECKLLIPTLNHDNLVGVDLENFFVKSKTEVTQSTSVTSFTKETVSIPSKEFHFDVPKNADDKTMRSANEVGAFSSWKAEFGPGTSERDTVETNVQVVGVTHDSKDKNEEYKDSPQSLDPNFEFDSVVGGLSQEHSSSGLIKGSDDLADDWIDFAGSGDVPAPSSNVCAVSRSSHSEESLSTNVMQEMEETLGMSYIVPQKGTVVVSGAIVENSVGYKGSNEKSNQSNQMLFSSSDFDAFFGGVSHKNKGNGTKEGSLNDGQDFSGSGDTSGSFSNACPLSSSSVSLESLKPIKSTEDIQDYNTINIGHNTIQETIDSGSNIVAQSMDIKNKRSDPPNQLSVSPSAYELLGAVPQEDNSNNVMKESDDFFSDWHEFAVPQGMPSPSSNVCHLAGLTVSHAPSEQMDSANLVQGGPTEEHNDALDDEWQEFAGSVDMRGTFSSMRSLNNSMISQESAKHTKSANPSQLEGANYLPPSPFSDIDINEGSCSSNHSPPVFTDFHRIGGMEGNLDFGNSRSRGNNSLSAMTSSSADSSVKEKVDMLLSEMHDLSFILEDQLQIPGT